MSSSGTLYFIPIPRNGVSLCSLALVSVLLPQPLSAGIIGTCFHAQSTQGILKMDGWACETERSLQKLTQVLARALDR